MPRHAGHDPCRRPEPEPRRRGRDLPIARAGADRQGERRSIAGITTLRRCRSASCCRSRPAAAPRIAATAPRRPATTPASTPTASLPGGRGAGRRALGEGRRRDAVLHGRGLARGQGRPAVRPRPGDGPGRQGAGPRGLLHARHARRRPGQAPEGGGPRRLQPQPRHVRGLLRPRHHHAHLSGSAGHAGERARGGRHRLLRRDRRHGRVGGRPDRSAAHPRHPARAAGVRPRQRPGGRRGDAARDRGRRSTSGRWSA